MKNVFLKHFFLFACLLLFAVGARAQISIIDGINYEFDYDKQEYYVSGVEDETITAAVIKDQIEGTAVTRIGEGAFRNCTSLKSVNIPATIQSIDGNAFNGCSSLTSVSIPRFVMSIGGLAFYGCSSLTSVNIPRFVKKIEDETFRGCSSLASVEIPSSVTSIGSSAFGGCSSLKSVNIPSSVTSIGEASFSWCSSLVSVNIPSSVTSIESYAFNRCSSLASVNIPSSVTSIGEAAFFCCSSLTSVNIPSSVTSIGGSAFSGCSSLTSVDIPVSVTSIAEDSFRGCPLVSVSIPSSVTNIGSGAFFNCSIVKIPSSVANVANIGSRAFGGASVISDSDIDEMLDIVNNAVSYVPYNKKITNDCVFYLYENLSNHVSTLIENYIKSKRIIDTYKEKYEALKGLQRQYLDDLINVDHLWSAFADDSRTVAYNDSLLEASDLMLYLFLDRKDYSSYSLLTSAYEQAVKVKSNNGGYNSDYSKYDGLIVDASQLSSNAKESSEGSYEGLIDNNRSTFFHSEWKSNVSNGAYHYLQIDLRDTYENIVLKYSTRYRSSLSFYYRNADPKTLHVYVTNAPDNEDSWIDLGRYTCTYDFVSDDTGLLNLDFDKPYRYVRLVVEETMSNEGNIYSGKPFFYWSELHAYPKYSANVYSLLTEEEQTTFDDAMTLAKSELDEFKGNDATYQTLQALLDKLDDKLDDSGLLLTDFSESSYLTLYSDKALTVPEGMQAAVVVSNGNGISSDYRYEAGSVIPAHTGVLIKGGKGNSFIFAEGETTEACPADNLLHGTLTDAMTEVDGDNKYYKLAYDNATHTQLGFYWGATDGAPFVNKAGKAYLAVPVATSLSQSMQGFSLNDLNNGVTTGLTVPTTTSGESLRIYDLNGRRINAQSIDGLQPGIYVVNGKKMYVK